MFGLIAASITRRPARTVLTATGVAVGVAMIVALSSITAGLERAAGGLISLGEGELGLFQRGVADPTLSVLPTSLADRLEDLPAIREATPIELIVEGIPEQPGAIVFGMPAGGDQLDRLTLLEGEQPERGELLLGDQLAQTLGAGVGDRVVVKGEPFTVSGVYHSGVVFQDTGATIRLEDAQALTGTPGEATTIAVRIAPSVSEARAREVIAERFGTLQIIGDPREAARSGANAQLISQAVTVILALALVVGAIAVTNTMVLSVIERERDLSLLLTVGWRARRVAGLVVAEALAVSLAGALLGLGLGVAAGELLVTTLDVGEFVRPQVTAWGLGRGLLVGIAIGAVGALYPAWRVTRMSPARLLAA